MTTPGDDLEPAQENRAEDAANPTTGQVPVPDDAKSFSARSVQGQQTDPTAPTSAPNAQDHAAGVPDATPPDDEPAGASTEPAVTRQPGVTRLNGNVPDPEITASAGEKRLEEEKKTKYAMPRFVSVTLGVAATVVVLYLITDLSAIIAPFFLGLNLMIAVHPIHRLLARVMPRFVAAIISLIAVLVILIGFIWGCIWALLELIKALPQYNQEFTALWFQIVDLASTLGLDVQWVNNALGSINPSDVMSLVGPVLSNLTSIISLLTTLVMATFFMAMDTPSMSSRMKILRVVQPRALAVVMDFSTGVRRYWVVATLFGLVVALLDVAALSIIGVPLIWVWGVLAFVTNYIPNIGFVVGLVPPALLALLDGGWQPAVVVVVVYCLLNFVIQVLIQPKITGESVGVTGTISFLSLLFWVIFLGPLGALLALPATLLVKALLVDADPKARWLNVFIASSPDTALPADEQPEPRSARKRRRAQERSALYGG
ncbi:AI-2E family transporter [Galactobacter sp.]|uniref:AI-2E family transporter n=1 Tax=Galactobacter sp. TaxID=2676125 RepID=UPI0025BD065D|nr:AI-2E family transporter [Galactobacter sp.]